MRFRICRRFAEVGRFPSSCMIWNMRPRRQLRATVSPERRGRKRVTRVIGSRRTTAAWLFAVRTLEKRRHGDRQVRSSLPKSLRALRRQWID